MAFRRVSKRKTKRCAYVRMRRTVFFSLQIHSVNIPELQKQPQEIKRELRNAREELIRAKEDDEQFIEGDRFTDAIEDFIIRADDDVARLERLDQEMTRAYDNLCDFLAIDPKNYSINEFFTDLKLFCTFFSVRKQSLTVAMVGTRNAFLHSIRLVFRKFVFGENKQLVQRKTRKFIHFEPTRWEKLSI